MIHHRAFVHAKAHVDVDTVQIRAGTKVWQYASITRGTVLGEDCSVSPFAMLDGSIYGDRVKWDIACLPFDPSVVGARAIGDKFRAATKALL